MPLLRSNSFSGLVGKVKDSSLRSITGGTGNGKRRGSSKTSICTALTSSVTELCLDTFEQFLSQSLSSQVDASTLEDLSRCLLEDDLRDTFTEMEIGLLSLLKSHPDLSTSLVGEIHSYLGLVYLEQENDNSAVDSFMRAIWFKSRTPEDKQGIARANHRLGVAYGRKGDYQQAMDLIDRAIDVYDTSSETYVMAKEDRHAFQEAHLLSLLAKTRPSAIRRELSPSPSSTSSEETSSSKGKRRSGRRRSSSKLGIARNYSGSTLTELTGGKRRQARRRSNKNDLARHNSNPNLCL